MCLQLAGDVREYCLRAGPGTAGLLPRDCWHGVCIAASFTWEGASCAFWIGNADLDRLFSHPQRRNLSSSWFPIQFVVSYPLRGRPCPHVSARGPDDMHVGSAEHDPNGTNTVGLVALNDADPELTIEI